MLYFFRDPERTVPDLADAVVSPADGRVLIAGDAEPAAAPPGDWKQISIFLSPLDVHINRIPIGGRVARVDYTPGRFLPAYRPESARVNERNEVWIERGGGTVVCRQVVGVLARRLVCRVGAGATVRTGAAVWPHEIRFADRLVPAAARGRARRGRGPGPRRRNGRGHMVNPDRDERQGDEDDLDPLSLRKWKRQRGPRLRRGVYLLPSLLTMGNMFCGYLCVLYAIRGEFDVAAPLIGVAVVLDMLDGRIARMTGTATAFGVEFDSMADVISFGIAPAVLTFMWGLQPLQRLGWAAGFIYLSAAAIRLARFNIQSVKSTDKRHFVGMPSPAAAAVPASTVFFYPEGLQDPRLAFLALAVVVVPALLMVSTIRFNSFKTIDTQKRRSYKVLALVALVIAVIQLHPNIVLLALAYLYMLGGLFGAVWARFRRRGTPPPSD